MKMYRCPSYLGCKNPSCLHSIPHTRHDFCDGGPCSYYDGLMRKKDAVPVESRCVSIGFWKSLLYSIVYRVNVIGVFPLA